MAKTGFPGYYNRGKIVATGEVFGYAPYESRFSHDSPLGGVPEDRTTTAISIATDEDRRPIIRRQIVELEDGRKYVVALVSRSKLYSILNPIREWYCELVATEEEK